MQLGQLDLKLQKWNTSSGTDMVSDDKKHAP